MDAGVLILVLVEDGLGGYDEEDGLRNTIYVLILVLVEDGLGAHQKTAITSRYLQSLNPCFSGGWSRRSFKKFFLIHIRKSLNPCFSGGWSRSVKNKENTVYNLQVLILVLVEDGLGDTVK